MAKLNGSSGYRISQSVVARMVGDEMVLMHLDSGNYFGLDPVGALVWRALEDGHAFDEVIAAVMQEYEVEFERVKGDVQALLAHLSRLDLIASDPAE